MKGFALKFAMLLLALGVFATVACTTEKSKERRTGGPHYFAWYEGKFWPERPAHPITEQEAKGSTYNGTYFVAYFDNDGRLLVLQKFLHSKPDWRSDYKYDSSGKPIERLRSDANGKQRKYSFDADGKPIAN